MLDLHRASFKNLEDRVAVIFSSLPFSPNFYTFGSFLLAVAAFAMVWKKILALGVVFFALAFALDFVDGAVARRKKMASARGAYFDTMTDRYVEALFLGSLFFLPFPDILLPSYVWIFLAMLGSTMTTYAKAAAKEKNLTVGETKGGLFSRGERVILSLVILTLALVNYSLSAWAVVALAVFSNLTAFQRAVAVLK